MHLVVHEMMVNGRIVRLVRRDAPPLLATCEVYDTKGQFADAFSLYSDTTHVLSLLQKHLGETSRSLTLLATYLENRISGKPTEDETWFQLLPFMEEASQYRDLLPEYEEPREEENKE